jgi:hypothetical protein
LLNFAVNSSLHPEGGSSDASVGAPCSIVSGGSCVAGSKVSPASGVSRDIAVEDGSGSQRQTSPHRRQFMGNNSDNNFG